MSTTEKFELDELFKKDDFIINMLLIKEAARGMDSGTVQQSKKVKSKKRRRK